jgi:hypothetical protein
MKKKNFEIVAYMDVRCLMSDGRRMVEERRRTMEEVRWKSK